MHYLVHASGTTLCLQMRTSKHLLVMLYLATLDKLKKIPTLRSQHVINCLLSKGYQFQ